MDVVAALEAEGVDLLEISGGTYERPAMAGTLAATRQSTAAREAFFLDYAKQVRARTAMPLMLTGGFRTREGMVEALGGEERGAIDLIGLARPLAQEPELCNGLLDGSATESRVLPRRTGINDLDSFLEVSWYSYQLQRMGEGREPWQTVSPWWVLANLGWRAASGRVWGVG